MLSMAFPHVLLRFSNGIVNNFIVSFPLPLVYAQDVGRKSDRDARKTAESGFGVQGQPLWLMPLSLAAERSWLPIGVAPRWGCASELDF